MLQKAFGSSTMSQKTVYKWYKDFKEGRERVENLERSERPSTSTDDQHVHKVKQLVLKNRRLTFKDFTDMIGISEGSVKTIFNLLFTLPFAHFSTTNILASNECFVSFKVT